MESHLSLHLYFRVYLRGVTSFIIMTITLERSLISHSLLVLLQPNPQYGLERGAFSIQLCITQTEDIPCHTLPVYLYNTENAQITFNNRSQLTKRSWSLFAEHPLYEKKHKTYHIQKYKQKILRQHWSQLRKIALIVTTLDAQEQ